MMLSCSGQKTSLCISATLTTLNVARVVSPLRRPKSSFHSVSIKSSICVAGGYANDNQKQVAAPSPALAASNLVFLRTIYKPQYVMKLVGQDSELLAIGLEEWYRFLTGYGLTDEEVWKVFRYSSDLLWTQSGSAGDKDSWSHRGVPNTPYNAGAAIIFLKSYGMKDEDIVRRVLTSYPRVLATPPEQLQAAVDFLRSRSFDDEAIRRLVTNFPQLLVPGVNNSLLQLIDRIRASARNKYVVSGSYHV